jgi:tetratricopeptide (TPR) repeat protein
LAAVDIGALAPAVAQTQQQIDWCSGSGGAAPDLQISGCTAVIQSGKYTGKNLAIAFNNRGVGYYKKQDYDRAIADYDQAIRVDPLPGVAADDRGRTGTNVYNNRGYAYFAKKDHARAIADYDRAIKVDPKDPLVYNNRGLAYSDTGEFDRAIADFGEAIRLDPKYAVATNNRGIAFYAKRDYDRAIADFDQAIRLDPK